VTEFCKAELITLFFRNPTASLIIITTSALFLAFLFFFLTTLGQIITLTTYVVDENYSQNTIKNKNFAKLKRTLVPLQEIFSI